MSNAADEKAADGASRFGEWFTVAVLLAMIVALSYLLFVLLPRQDAPRRPPFEFSNPMLDARPGERVLFFGSENPTNLTCSVVRPEGVVLRPRKGPDRIGYFEDLRTRLPYLACGIKQDVRGAGSSGGRGADPCGGTETDTVLYALNYFGMPADTKVRVDSIRPRWMKWGQRELVVYEVVFERYGTLGGLWKTFLAEEAPVAGLVKWTTLLPKKTEVHYKPAQQARK